MTKKDSGVSPVIAVMLMLVVTIIIAAVVSGFAGGLAGSNSDRAPTVTMDVKIVNTGSWIGSGFFASVTGTSEPIRTKDLKLVTQWKSSGGISGGNSTRGGVYNYDAYVGMGTNARYSTSVSPYGFGSGVNSSASQNPTKPHTVDAQQFGNYSLTVGTTMHAWPAGAAGGVSIGGAAGKSATSGYGIATPFVYTDGTDYDATMTDAVDAVLGHGWQTLRQGDKVSVSVVHIPSGKTIFQREIAVTEG